MTDVIVLSDAGFDVSTAIVLEEFGHVIAQGGAGVVSASQSGHRLPMLTPAQDHALATTPADELLDLPMFQPDQVVDPLHPYQLAKRANPLRVMAEAVRWGKRGARVNAISPGSDFLMDGGVTAAYWYGDLAPTQAPA